MDRPLIIDINSKALLRIVAGVFAMVGMVAGGTVDRLPRRLQRMVFDMLRPAEAATRRLIAILAAGLVVEPPARRSAPAGAIPRGKGGRSGTFPLFDPRKRVGPPPRSTAAGRHAGVRSFDDVLIPSEPSPEPSPEDMLDATRLCQRLNAVLAALNDLPGQAQRLAGSVSV